MADSIWEKLAPANIACSLRLQGRLNSPSASAAQTKSASSQLNAELTLPIFLYQFVRFADSLCALPLSEAL